MIQAGSEMVLPVFLPVVKNKRSCRFPGTLFFLLGIMGINPKASFGNRFRSKLRGIKYLLMRYNSTNKLPFASLLKFESHCNLPIPLRFAFGIGVSTIKQNYYFAV